MEEYKSTLEIMVEEQEAFYENQTMRNNQTREKSPIIFLLGFQNYIKSMLINQVTYGQSGLSVLDLCCGKGGDIPGKWKKAKLSHYVGVDLSAESVKEAQNRYIKTIVEDARSANEAFPAIFIVADCGDSQNLVNDILEKDTSLKKLRSRIVFDVVSTQFAIHYMFESEVKLRAFLNNVTNRLEDGGVFIGTTIDSDRLVHKIRQSKSLTIGNDYY